MTIPDDNFTVFRQPIVIVGAPRSGTSLIYSILREQPGCLSLAKESGIIWNHYCHPSQSSWYASQCPTEFFTPETRAEIHRQFASFAMSSSLWNRLEKLDILKYRSNRLLAATLRNAYSWLARARRGLSQEKQSGRLIEKSVGTIFSLDFVNYVFPDALFIRVLRDGRATIRSMIDAWQDDTRFFTYNLPISLNIKGYRHQYWNFALPPGWRDCESKTLTETVARQWVAMQLAIDAGVEQADKEGRVLTVRLEDLTRYAEHHLQGITAFTGLDWNKKLASRAANLPVINATSRNSYSNPQKEAGLDEIDRILPLIKPLLSKQGYPA